MKKYLFFLLVISIMVSSCSKSFAEEKYEKYKDSVIKIKPIEYIHKDYYIKTKIKVSNQGNETITGVTINCSWMDKSGEIYMTDSKIISTIEPGEKQEIVFGSYLNSRVKNMPSNISDSFVILVDQNLINIHCVFTIKYNEKYYLYNK